MGRVTGQGDRKDADDVSSTPRPYGRVCNLRGVNLSGPSKSPTDDEHENFPGDRKFVTFVGRPFPLEEAPEHFARLRRWGLKFLVRFLVTSEAVEHERPYTISEAFHLYCQTTEYRLMCTVSLDQNVWSRYSGGSGLPAWTLEVVGFDVRAIEEVGAAWLLGVRGEGTLCGYQKLNAATMTAWKIA